MEKYTKYLMPTIYIGVIAVMVVSVMLVVTGVKNYLTEEPKYNYTLDDFFQSDLSPVVSTKSDTIIRPYIDDKVKVGKYFYDFESDADKQEGSLIYFENTYMQNKGVDYVNDEDFDVLSVLDGEIISVEENEVYGKVITIKHNDNLKTVYSNVTDVLVATGYKVSQGEIIASSTSSKLDTENKSLLHFEVYYKENPMDPENLYTLKVNELE